MVPRKCFVALPLALMAALTFFGLARSAAAQSAKPAEPATAVIVAQSAKPAAAAPSVLTDKISEFGITWTFDKKYPSGQFANGDYWVVGPVKIVSIDPPSTEKDGRIANGSEINPSPRLGLTQGFDNGMYKAKGPAAHYDPKLNVAFDVGPQKPLDVPADSSLVSTISVSAWSEPQIETVAILTVLKELPPPGAFRPPYCGQDKTPHYTLSRLKWSLLKKLEVPKSAPKMAEVAAWFERPWLDYCPQWGGKHRCLHPKTSMPDYSRDMCYRVSTAALALLLDLPDADKETLLARFVQLGIDNYGVVQDGGEHNFPPGGGQSNGRKWPIIFAGLMLGNQAMAHVKMDSCEDGQTYYAHCWTGAWVCWGDYHTTEPNYDHEEKPPTAWTADGRGRPGDARFGSESDARSENYRRCCTSPAWVGEALAARLLNAVEDWNHPAFFDYVDRWATEDDVPLFKTIFKDLDKAPSLNSGFGEGIGKGFVGDLWNKYRSTIQPPPDGWKHEHKEADAKTDKADEKTGKTDVKAGK